METSNRKSINDKLGKYCTFANDSDYIEVTEWTNGEGLDVTLSSKDNSRIISLTIGELEAINYLFKSLEYVD